MVLLLGSFGERSHGESSRDGEFESSFIVSWQANKAGVVAKTHGFGWQPEFGGEVVGKASELRATSSDDQLFDPASISSFRLL